MDILSHPLDDHHSAGQHGIHFLSSITSVYKVGTKFSDLRQLQTWFVQRHVPVEIRKDGGHVKCLELLKQKIECSLLFERLLVPPLDQDDLGHHELQQHVQEDPDEVSVLGLPSLSRLRWYQRQYWSCTYRTLTCRYQDSFN